MSENSIHHLLSKVMEDVGAVRKEDRNQHQGFNFRGIDAVVKAVYPALVKHGVVVVPNLVDYTYESIEVGARATKMQHVVVKVDYVFHAPDGSSLTTRVAGEAMDSGDKGLAKAMSVAFRTALLQSLCLPTDEPDPDSFSPGQETPKKVAAKVAAPKKAEPVPTLESLMSRLESVAASANTDVESLTGKWRTANGDLSMEQFKELPPAKINTFVTQVESYVRSQRS